METRLKLWIQTIFEVIGPTKIKDWVIESELFDLNQIGINISNFVVALLFFLFVLFPFDCSQHLGR